MNLPATTDGFEDVGRSQYFFYYFFFLRYDSTHFFVNTQRDVKYCFNQAINIYRGRISKSAPMTLCTPCVRREREARVRFILALDGQ